MNDNTLSNKEVKKMKDNKKPGEPPETEGRGIFHYMRTHKPPWWLYWSPAIIWAITVAIVSIAIWRKG